MSDRQSRNYEEVRKSFYSSVSGRTRAKRNAYCWIDAEAQGISTAFQDLTRERKKRKEMQPAPSVGGQRKKYDVYVDVDEPGIVRIDDSEFIHKRKCPASTTRGSKMQGLDKDLHAANSSKIVNFPRKKPFATVEISHEVVGNRRFLVQEGNNNEDSDAAGIEKIDKAEFISLVSFSMSKIGSSDKEKLTESLSAAAPMKDDNNVSKRENSVGYSGSFCPKDAFHGSDHAWPRESSSFVLIESDSDDTISEDIVIRGADEARKQKTHSKSKRGQSADQRLCAARFRTNIDGSSKRNVSSANHFASFASRDYRTGSDMLADDSIGLAEKANNDVRRSSKEIKNKGNDEGLLRKGKSPLIREGYNAVSSRKKKTDIVKEVPFEKYSGLSSKHACSDTLKKQADRSSPSAEKVNIDDDASFEQLGIEKIDESEFRNLRRKFVSESTSSTRQERDEEHIAAISRKNVRRMSEKISSKKGKADHSTRKKNVDDVNSCSNKFICSSSSNKSNSNDVSKSLQDSEESSYGANQEKGVGVARRTRSRMGRIKKPAEVGNVSLDLPTNSDSSSTDSGDDNSLDSDFKVESSDDEVELSGSHDEACEVQEENEEMGGSFRDDADAEEGLRERNNVHECRCSKQFDTPKGRDKVKVVNGGQSQAGTRRPKEVARPSHSKNRYDRSGDETEATTSNLHVCAKTKTKDVVNETKVQTGPKEAAPPTHSKDAYDRSSDETEERTEATGSHSHVCAKNRTSDVANEMKVPTGPKEAAPPSLSKHGYDRSSDETEERTEATGSHSHVRAKNRTSDVANEMKVPTGPKEAAPPSLSKHGYDHSDDCTKEITEETSSHFHVRAEKMTAVRANKKKVSTGPKEAAPTCHSKEFYDHTVDGTKERTGATSSGSLGRAKTRTADMANEKKVPTRTKEAAPPSQIKDAYDHTEERTGTTSSGSLVQSEDMANEMEEPTGRKQVSSRKVKDLCSVLADAVLGKGQTPEIKEIYEEAEQVTAFQTQDILPVKFRFEDEVPQQAEKTEYEKEIDSLFADLDRDWALDELQSFDYHEDNVEKENSPAEETQHARCSRGKHELVLEDDEGLICIFCRHVEIAPKDIMPEWAERTYRDSGRKRNHEMEEPLNFDELHGHPSSDDDADAGNTIDATGTVWSMKPGVRESMYEHQREGFEFLWKNLAGSINIDELKSNDPVKVGGCIISHAPGTGKTRLTIVFVETFIRMFPKCRPVIISPASTLLTWEEEFRKWNVKFPFHNLNNPELSGRENKTALRLLPRTKIRDTESVRMMKICSWDMGGSILGISYSLFEKLTGDNKGEAGVSYNEKVKKILLEKPGLVVLDEGHTPRNKRSNIWNVLSKLQTEKRVILSGTPFQNNFGELFNTLSIVRPAMADMLAKEKTFAEMVAPRRKSSRRKYRGESLQTPMISEVVDRAVENLKSCMSPFVHLHRGTILQKSLPGLRDCVILLKPPALQKSLIETLGEASNFKHEHEVAMTSVHPYLFLKFETTEDRKIGIDMGAVAASKLNCQEGVKTRFLLELVRLSLAVKEKVLVFSQYIDPLELIKDQLKSVFKWVEGREILHIQGRQISKQRQSLIHLFNDAQSEAKIMLASTKCCSEGISLVGASRVVLLDVVWNPSVERQAICRAYRIGQKKFVHTYHLMTSGTSEADKYCRQAEKERLSELVFSSSNASDQQKLPSLGEDSILEVMVANESLKEMFEKIINQPKETDLIQTFGLTS